MKKKAYTTKKKKQPGPESNSIVILFIYIKNPLNIIPKVKEIMYFIN